MNSYVSYVVDAMMYQLQQLGQAQAIAGYQVATAETSYIEPDAVMLLMKLK